MHFCFKTLNLDMLKQLSPYRKASFNDFICMPPTFLKLALFCVVFLHLGLASHANKYAGYDETQDATDLDETYALDLAIKLKQDYADDLVSDLFATTYGLEKIARVPELDRENNLFHFKLANLLLDTENMQLDEIPIEEQHVAKRRRTKRHVYNKVEELRQDDRVEYVLPQRYLNREKRDDTSSQELYKELKELFDKAQLDPAYDVETQERDVDKRSRNDDNDLELIEKSIDELSQEIDANNRKMKRKKMQDHFAEEVLRQIDLDQINAPKLEKSIDFNDKNYKQEWYLINEGQLKIPLMHDLNVKQAWLKGYTGKNVTIVIIDDGIDHEHPDFEGKYVNNRERLFLSYRLIR